MYGIFRVGAVTLALAMTLASCSASSAREAAGDPATNDPLYMVESLEGVDGCGLLTRSEIERAFGGTVSAGSGDQAGNCTWQVGADPALAGTGPGVVGVGGAPHQPTARGVEDTYTDMRQRLGVDAVDVQGIGRAAHYVGDSGGFPPGTVTFHTGDDVVWVQASFEPARPGTKEQLIELARAVARRL